MAPSNDIQRRGQADLDARGPRGPVGGSKAPARSPGTDAALGEERERKEEQALWESSLGEWLGGELYDLVREHLSADDVREHANDAVRSAVEASEGVLSKAGSGTKGEDEALDKFTAALATAVTGASGAWLQTPKGKKLAEAVANYTKTHPRTVFSIAVLAAAGAAAAAWATDAKLGGIGGKVKLGGGLKAGLKGDFGSIQHVALQSITASLEYHKGNLQAGVEVTRTSEGVISGSASARLKGEKGSIGGTGTVKADGTFEVKADANYVVDAWEAAAEATGTQDGLEGASASLIFREENYERRTSIAYKDGDGFALRLGETFREDMYTLSNTYERGLSGQGDMGTLGAAVGTDALRFSLDLAMRDARREAHDGVGDTAKFGLTSKPSEHTSITGDLMLDQGSGTLASYGLRFGYDDPEKFRKVILDYHREMAGDVPVDNFLLHAQGRLNDRFSLGGRATAELNNGALDKGKLNVLGGYHTSIGSEPITLLAGAEQDFGPGGQMGETWIKAGVEIRDVPLTIKYSPETKTTMFQIELFKF